MRKNQLEYDYFEWLCNLVCSVSTKQKYESLLLNLYETTFYYILEMDSNRVIDGIELRYRFGREHHIQEGVIASQLDYKSECSVLEMLVALSLRVEENIMNEHDAGDQTGKWFWMMIENLGLHNMTDDFYDENYIQFSLRLFMDRKYESNGEGGLVVLKNPRQDLRFVEIWYQIMWYLSENYI